MPWMENNAVSEQKDSPPQDESGSGDMKITDLFQMLCEHILDSRFDQQEKNLDEIMKMTRETSQREASLEHEARQPRLAMEADGPADTKTRKCTEGAAPTLQAVHGDSCTAQKGSRWTEDLDLFRHDGRTSRSPLQGWHFGRERRRVAQVVSPILGDALTNSR